MNFDESFPKRVSMARNSLKLTQAELAKKVGVVPRQIAAYEGGEAKPRSKVLVNLAAALGTTTEWLSCGEGIAPDLKNVRSTVTTIDIPIYNSSADTFSDDQLWSDHIYEEGYIQAPVGVTENAFAIVIMGDSMDSPYGLSIPAGSLVVIEPNIEPSNEDFVLVQHGGFATLKKIILNSQGRFLESLNPAYPMYRLEEDGTTILGIAIQVIINLKSENLMRSYPNRPTHYSIDETIGEENSVDIELPTVESRLSRIEFMLEQLLNKD
ncbi:TPA: helix-turn-helix domain-containing protein [Providencia rettgeri]|nr:helix-turn-helix domain-containing protein [Providencia rettgeri]